MSQISKRKDERTMARITETTGTQTQKFTPCLWFDGKGEEAANFYTSVFKNSRVHHVARYSEEGAKASGRPKGSAMTVSFRLEGQDFLALNGGPMYSFTPAISFIVNCDSQAEVDHFWEKLSEGGKKVQCGWLQDRFGVSWQIVPRVLGELMQDKDPEKSNRVMGALMQMEKIDIAALERAAGQG
jgi:predicted 3-demethylubiquinone-9 3-methyltransferase (glyoxalase superfamily)